MRYQINIYNDSLAEIAVKGIGRLLPPDITVKSAKPWVDTDISDPKGSMATVGMSYECVSVEPAKG